VDLVESCRLCGRLASFIEQSLEAFRAAKKADSLDVMGRYIPNIQPLLLEIATKESQLRAQESEYALVLSRLEGLEVSDDTKAIFELYVNGELTIKELSTAIDEYLILKARSVPISGSERP
jgi:Antitoxin VbhA